MYRDKLDKEETELSATYDAGEWHSIAEVQSETARYHEAARATLLHKYVSGTMVDKASENNT
jgi:hypothetical protein